MPLIGTHDGKFHADEALGIFLLQQLPEYKESRVLRSRDPSLLATCDLVLDVGGIYDANALRFDHHQRDFAETLSPQHRTKLSSAGLIYKHFGRKVIQQLCQQATQEELDIFYDKLYTELIEEFDAVDNGISAWPATLEPAFKVGATTVFARVERLNPEWNEEQNETVTNVRPIQTILDCAYVCVLMQSMVEHTIMAWFPTFSLLFNHIPMPMCRVVFKWLFRKQVKCLSTY